LVGGSPGPLFGVKGVLFLGDFFSDPYFFWVLRDPPPPPGGGVPLSPSLGESRPDPRVLKRSRCYPGFPPVLLICFPLFYSIRRLPPDLPHEPPPPPPLQNSPSTAPSPTKSQMPRLSPFSPRQPPLDHRFSPSQSHSLKSVLDPLIWQRRCRRAFTWRFSVTARSRGGSRSPRLTARCLPVLIVTGGGINALKI